MLATNILNAQQITIRRAINTDLKQITACALTAYQHYAARMGRDPAPMHADFSSLIARAHIDMACYQSRFAGYAVSYPVAPQLMHLEGLAVLPALQGKGIGKALVEHVEKQAIAAGSDQVVLYTNAAMTENLSLYPYLGYTETDRRREDGFDRVFFRKVLI